MDGWMGRNVWGREGMDVLKERVEEGIGRLTDGGG